MVIFLDMINVLASLAVIPLTILTAGLFAMRKKANKGEIQKKRYEKYRRIHIPLGIADLCCGLFHAAFASWKHGWYFSPGKVCAALLIALVLVYMLRKQVKHWFAWHKALSLCFVIVLHVVLIPVTMSPDDVPGPPGMNISHNSASVCFVIP